MGNDERDTIDHKITKRNYPRSNNESVLDLYSKRTPNCTCERIKLLFGDLSSSIKDIWLKMVSSLNCLAWQQ